MISLIQVRDIWPTWASSSFSPIKFFVKDFSATTATRILKFGTNVEYDFVVLCKRESACTCLSFPLFVHFSFSPIKFFVTVDLAPMRARIVKFFVHLRGLKYIV